MFQAVHVSIAVPIVGTIPNDKEKMVASLQNFIDSMPEQKLKRFRESVKSL